MWGLSVSLVRMVSQTVGIEAGLALNYTLAFLIVWLLFGAPDVRKMPLKYYICGLGSAITCAVTFAYSLTIATNGTQAMEVGMINYLWPSLTIIFAVLFNKQPAKWWLAIGLILAMYGICMVLSGSVLVNFALMYEHLLENPLSYFLGLLAALAWAAYSNFTKAWANGQNPTVLIFGLDIILFNCIWLSGVGGPANFTFKGVAIVAIMAAVMGLAYGLWTLGVQHGYINIMSIASFFTPVLSCLFASFLIGAKLNGAFWAGVAVVVLGSFVSWMATKEAMNKQKI